MGRAFCNVTPVAHSSHPGQSRQQFIKCHRYPRSTQKKPRCAHGTAVSPLFLADFASFRSGQDLQSPSPCAVLRAVGPGKVGTQRPCNLSPAAANSHPLSTGHICIVCRRHRSPAYECGVSCCAIQRLKPGSLISSLRFNFTTYCCSPFSARFASKLRMADSEKVGRSAPAFNASASAGTLRQGFSKSLLGAFSEVIRKAPFKSLELSYPMGLNLLHKQQKVA